MEELVHTLQAYVPSAFHSFEELRRKACLYIGTIHIARARSGTGTWCWDLFTTRERVRINNPRGFVPQSHIQHLQTADPLALQELVEILRYSSKRGADDKFKFRMDEYRGTECYVERDGMELPLGTQHFCLKSDEPLPRVKPPHTQKRSRQEDQIGK